MTRPARHPPLLTREKTIMKKLLGYISNRFGIAIVLLDICVGVISYRYFIKSLSDTASSSLTLMSISMFNIFGTIITTATGDFLRFEKYISDQEIALIDKSLLAWTGPIILAGAFIVMFWRIG